MKEKEIVKQLRKLTRKSNAIIMQRNNTILALRNSVTKEITHLVQPNAKNGLLVVVGVLEECYVPRYERSIARQWLNEEYEDNKEELIKEIGYYFEKCLLTLGEHKKLWITNARKRSRHLRGTLKLDEDKFKNLWNIYYENEAS